ncbi:amidase [Marinihelvus fidelis]|uniref:Amidase n=1 Tax=Marinihelvus fidelis TaxID=2613842 RepID=A0A5N0T5W9_9GAMM|nr:amidase family protein [Marinihelvus fidelis]KAA9130445.1 amidase [Marinihelvus fidelis]
MIKHKLLVSALFCVAASGCQTTPDEYTATHQDISFSVVDTTIPEIQQALQSGRVTSRELVDQYLQRIALYELDLRATMAVNHRAQAIADQLDEERREGIIRGPLHGIPIALKDNIHTIDMPTTAGAMAFEGFIPPYEATIVTNLKRAGAIIIAKTTMTELANWVATGMPDNYSALRGDYGMNPYDPRRDPRKGFNDGRPVMSPGGSSSGIGTAASFWAGNVGTQTSGSLVIPSNNNMLVGIDPTIGRLSRHGIIPITLDQDSAGPMTRTVAGAAIMLGAMENAENHDDNDPAIGTCEAVPNHDYTAFLDKDGLRGARIGVPRAFYYDPVTPPGETEPRGGLKPGGLARMNEVIAVLKANGAIIVDPVVVPSHVATNPDDNQLLFGNCYDTQVRGNDQDCSIVMKYGMKRDFNHWLASLGDTAPVVSLAALREFNASHPQLNAIKYDQQELDFSDEMDIERDRERYETDRAKDLRLTRAQGIDAALQSANLDALLIPAWLGEQLADKAGYPQIIVPYGTYPLTFDPPLPEGFLPAEMPYGVTFMGTACSEPELIRLAYSFEQNTKRRVPPPLFP